MVQVKASYSKKEINNMARMSSIPESTQKADMDMAFLGDEVSKTLDEQRK